MQHRLIFSLLFLPFIQHGNAAELPYLIPVGINDDSLTRSNHRVSSAASKPATNSEIQPSRELCDDEKALTKSLQRGKFKEFSERLQNFDWADDSDIKNPGWKERVLYEVSINGNPKACEFMLNLGANPNQQLFHRDGREHTPLQQVIFRIKFHGTDEPKAKGWTFSLESLMTVACSLIRCGADVNFRYPHFSNRTLTAMVVSDLLGNKDDKKITDNMNNALSILLQAGAKYSDDPTISRSNKSMLDRMQACLPRQLKVQSTAPATSLSWPPALLPLTD